MKSSPKLKMSGHREGSQLYSPSKENSAEDLRLVERLLGSELTWSSQKLSNSVMDCPPSLHMYDPLVSTAL